jgi:hypothetical protein
MIACPEDTLTACDQMPLSINFLSNSTSHISVLASTVKSNSCGTFCSVPIGGRLVV